MGTGSFLEGMLVSGSELLQKLSLTSWSLASCFQTCLLPQAFHDAEVVIRVNQKDAFPRQLQLTTGYSLE